MFNCQVVAFNDMGHLNYRIQGIPNELHQELYNHLNNCFIRESIQRNNTYVNTFRQIRGFHPKVLDIHGNQVLCTLNTETNTVIF